jgi:hypothetical protein
MLPQPGRAGAPDWTPQGSGVSAFARQVASSLVKSAYALSPYEGDVRMAECPQAELVYGYVSRASGHMKDVMVAVTREDGPCVRSGG